jgi:predicted phosphodiesterase
MQYLDNNLPFIFLGDHHGQWSELDWIISKKNLRDCYICSVGDSGIGFSTKEIQLKKIEYLNSEFKTKNIIFMSIRGNHDDPSYFTGPDRPDLSNFKLIEDYTVMNYNNKKIQFIGGAVSIDRTGRQEGVSYWAGEPVTFIKEKCEKVDVLVTHTTASFCFPQTFNEMVYGWAREDAYLLEDLTDERAVMDEIFKLCDPSLQVYGHFHSSRSETINNCVHKLLDINELWQPTLE